MDELARRIVAVNAKGLMARAFPCNVSTRVRPVADRALVCWGLAVSLGKFAILKLPVYEI